LGNGEDTQDPAVTAKNIEEIEGWWNVIQIADSHLEKKLRKKKKGTNEVNH